MLTFVILVVVFILGKFLIDCANQSSEMAAQGGMKKKYGQLIQMLLDADPRSKILQETNTFINVGAAGPAGSQSFLLQQTFGKLNAQIVIKNNPLVGDVKIERIFPENMDQKEMMKELVDAQVSVINNRLARYI